MRSLNFISYFAISPFVAAIPYPYEFRSNPREVEEIVEVPIAALLDKGNFKEEQKYRDGKLVHEYSYEYRGWVIWGATARILKQFLEVVSSPIKEEIESMISRKSENHLIFVIH